ncbi:MAG TPA: TlpA disulfide reductase family protein [Steroidobacteraceae bacterium]|jgi:thiol-disulfide isomerase/thioredoxin|nr:TlpA disulfide reductase family protein [Steroidobacteraceae bacterium]
MNERALRLAGAVLVVVVGVWAGVRIHSARRADHLVPGVPTPVGVASPPTPSDLIGESAPQPTRIPDRLPEFSLSNLEGKSTPIGTWAGRSLIINFWATWCAPCRREIPLLESLSTEWADRGVQVIGIAVDHRDQVGAFARQLKIGYPLLIGEQDALDVAAALGFGSPVFPFTVFTDRRGEVVALYVGELGRPQASLILSVVHNLNQDHIELKEARRSIAEGLHRLASSTPG